MFKVGGVLGAWTGDRGLRSLPCLLLSVFVRSPRGASGSPPLTTGDKHTRTHVHKIFFILFLGGSVFFFKTSLLFTSF